MAETNEVLPACPWPNSATFLTFSPVYTFTGSPPSEATNLTQLKLQAQLRGRLWASALGLRIGLATHHVGTGALTRPVERQLDDKSLRVGRTVLSDQLQIPKPPRYPWSPMHRLTARLLLLILALGIFQPLLEAFSAEPPHACCLRRLHAQKDQPLQLRDASKLNGNCCPPLTAPHIAQPKSGDKDTAIPLASELVVSAINARSGK